MGGPTKEELMAERDVLDEASRRARLCASYLRQPVTTKVCLQSNLRPLPFLLTPRATVLGRGVMMLDRVLRELARPWGSSRHFPMLDKESHFMGPFANGHDPLPARGMLLEGLWG